MILRPASGWALLALVMLAGCGAGPRSSPAAGAPATAAVATGQVTQGSVTSPAPRSTAVAGRLVTGFPAVVPLPPGAHVTASAVQSQGDLLAVSVTGTSPQPVIQLLAFIRQRLIRAGFTATDNSLLPAGTSGAAFGRHGGVEMLIVAVVNRGAERSFSIGGTVSNR